ncbi:SdrD B-like domain-containing protein, partial [Kiritimatiellaeota bacterium B1221]|nr:SdrD B-like domain-containing protein [Kiritimatiellaeota bacterium B1221]
NEVTNGSGAYDFTGLAAGTYSVQVDENTVTSGFIRTGGTNPQSVTLAAGEDYNDADFGFQQQDASIGDFVWNDLNGDGVQDGGEPGLSGITLYLDLNSNGNLDGGEPSAVTDGSGAYDFTDLSVGSYSVRVDTTTTPAGFVRTGGANPRAVTIAAGEDFNGADFGYQQQDATVGDFVWNDLNGDGVQDGGEPGLSGVTVYLDLNSNGILDGGEPIAGTVA